MPRFLRGALAVVAAAVLLALGATAVLPRAHDAPDITLRTMQGADIPLAQLRGEVVLVNFWATTCAICREEMPHLAALQRELGSRGFQVIGVSMSYDPPWIVADYATRQALPFVVAPDIRGDIERAFGGIDGTPTSFLIDPRGKIVERIVGRPDFAALRARIVGLLREEPRAATSHHEDTKTRRKTKQQTGA